MYYHNCHFFFLCYSVDLKLGTSHLLHSVQYFSSCCGEWDFFPGEERSKESSSGGGEIAGEKENKEVLVDGGNDGKLEKEVVVPEESLQVLWDDGYGKKTVKDFIDGAKEMIMPGDAGPPRWFCPPDCGKPLKDSPVLLYCPGIDSVGLGLTLHHKALGK
ncbi:hypothetical protein Tsubulata_046403 [Turnera subulata]|uniref:Uncharacterized protein n=1 Tax=Turnera subulata TaxID=218843 RepID=A0A9Q0FVS8_9ROSI|nr:hypothetical protein Tsubulata_046403 [Turnera subulata]